MKSIVLVDKRFAIYWSNMGPKHRWRQISSTGLSRNPAPARYAIGNGSFVEPDFAIRLVSKEYGSFGMEPDILKTQFVADLIGLYFWYKHLGFNCAQLAGPERLRAGSIKNMWGQTSSL